MTEIIDKSSLTTEEQSLINIYESVIAITHKITILSQLPNRQEYIVNSYWEDVVAKAKDDTNSFDGLYREIKCKWDYDYHDLRTIAIVDYLVRHLPEPIKTKFVNDHMEWLVWNEMIPHVLADIVSTIKQLMPHLPKDIPGILIPDAVKSLYEEKPNEA